MPDEAQYSADDIKAACQRWVAEGHSWDDLVENTLELLARIGEHCRHRRLSRAESNIAGNFIDRHFRMLEELDRDGDTYYGYRAEPNLWSMQMDRIQAAYREVWETFRERWSDQSPGAKAEEARLSARYFWETDRNAQTSGLPRTHDFPVVDGMIKEESSLHIEDYQTKELNLESPRHEDEYRWRARPGFYDVSHVLAHYEKDLRGYDDPAETIRSDAKEYAKQQSRLGDPKDRWRQPTSDMVLDAPLATDGTLAHDRKRSGNTARDEERQAADQPEGGLKSFIDIYQIASSIESDIESARIQLARPELSDFIATLPLPPDHLRAIKAKVIEGLKLQSPATAKHLGWPVARLERVRRSLLPDQKWGKVLREYLAACNPAQEPR